MPDRHAMVGYSRCTCESKLHHNGQVNLDTRQRSTSKLNQLIPHTEQNSRGIPFTSPQDFHLQQGSAQLERGALVENMHLDYTWRLDSSLQLLSVSGYFHLSRGYWNT